MRLETILTRMEKHKSFVYEPRHLEESPLGPTLVVQIRSRENGRAVCSGGGECGPTYDPLPERRFDDVPRWGIAVFFAYRMRRVNCRSCGVKVERVPWCDGKHSQTTRYRCRQG